MKQQPHEWTPLHALPNALCREAFELDHMALWDYDITGEEPEDRTVRLNEGLAICRTCPDIEDCHAWALQNFQVVSGVWGGQIFVPMEDRSRFIKCANCTYPVFGADKRQGKYKGQTVFCVKCAGKWTASKKLC